MTVRQNNFTAVIQIVTDSYLETRSCENDNIHPTLRSVTGGILKKIIILMSLDRTGGTTPVLL